MPLPEPKPGLVIGYAYLWRTEQESRLEEGGKDRPCAIVLARVQADRDTVVMVAPITHSPPRMSGTAVELPDATKRRLGLDDQRSWVVVSEVNRFIWPGPDIRPVSRDEPQCFSYGFLPPRLFKTLTRTMAELQQQRRLAVVARS